MKYKMDFGLLFTGLKYNATCFGKTMDIFWSNQKLTK